MANEGAGETAPRRDRFPSAAAGESSRGRPVADLDTDRTPRSRPTTRAVRPDGPITPDELLRMMSMNSDARAAESRRLVDLALTDRLNFETLRAEEKLEIALKLDPTNERAARLLAQIRNEMGDPRGEVAQIHREISDEVNAARQQLISEVDLLIHKGKRLDEEEQHQQAMEKYEKAIEVIRYNSLNLNLDEQRQRAENALEISKKLQEERLERERRELEAAIRQEKMAERESSLRILKNRLAELRRKARQALRDQDYELAEQSARLILEDYPEDLEARRIVRQARERQHIQKRQRLFNESVENYRLAMLGVRESSVLYHQIFRFPPRKEWERLKPEEFDLQQLVAESETPVAKEIKRKLEEPQDIRFEAETPFKEAIDTLRQLSGLNIVLNRQALEAIDAEGLTIQLARVQNLALKNVLNLILNQAGDNNFAYSIEDGALVIGPRDSLSTTYFLHFYDVFDITQPHPDFPAPPLALDSLEGQEAGAADFGGDAFGVEDDQPPGIGPERLRELIEKELQDPVTDEQIGSVKYQNGKLAVRTTFEFHEKVNNLLEELRKATGIMVTVESRFLALQDNFLEEIGVDIGSGNTTFLPNTIPDIDGTGTSVAPGYEFVSAQQDFNVRAATLGGFSNPLGSRVNPFNLTSAGGGAYQLNVLTDQYQLEAILTGVAKEQEIKRLSSPRVTAFNTQIAHTLVINQAAYIKDLEVNQTGVVPVINPRIGVLNSGSILEVRPNVSYDRKYIVLEIQPTLAERLDSEFAILNLSGNFTVVPVELPVTSVTQIKTTVTIPDGGTVLVGGLKREVRSKVSVGIPGIRHVPVLNLIFGRKGNSTLRSNLFVLINARVTIVQEEEEKLFSI